MLDWDDLRFFLAVARHRTLAAAARHLRVTQSTVGRRLASLQADMGVRLLQRTADGYTPTLAGESIRQHVERVESEALAVERAVAGQDVRLEGVVRVASSQLLMSHLLAPCFTDLHSRSPAILIEASTDPAGEPLASQDADISVRLRRFDHHDLVVRNIGVLAFALYAGASYVARMGEPEPSSGCAGHHLITALDERELSAQAAWLGEHADRAKIVLRADSYETQHWAACRGGGLAVLPRFRADAEPALHRIAAPPVPSAEIWLGVHRENRQVPRVRAVLDCIVEAAHARAALLDPAPAPDTAA